MSDTNTIRAKLLAAMREMDNPAKIKTATVKHKSGDSHSYTYTDLATVLSIIRPALQNHGADVRQGVQYFEPVGGFVYETIVFDETDELILDRRPYREHTDPQATGSWETYNRRYADLATFGLAAEDDDGQAAKGAQRQPEPSSRPIGPKRDQVPTAKNQTPANDLNRFTELKNRLAAARGVSGKEAADELVAVFGNPRGMDAEQFDSMIRNGATYVAAVERGTNEAR